MYIKCWAFDIRVVLNGEVKEVTKKYRIRETAAWRKKEATRAFAADPRISEFHISAPYRIERD